MLIVFEGLDGCGKSTHAKLLADRLAVDGKAVLFTREPGGTEVGETFRTMLKDDNVPMASTTEYLLFLASRAQLLSEEVIPALEEGKIVILDRYFYSTLVYQIMTANHPENHPLSLGYLEYHMKMCYLMAYKTLPDIVLHLTTDEDRLEERENTDKFERIAPELLKEGYDLLEAQDMIEGEAGRFRNIDSSGSVEDTHELVMEEVRLLLEEQQWDTH